MKIALGADHAGFALKQELRQKLSGMGHEVTDFGTMPADSIIQVFLETKFEGGRHARRVATIAELEHPAPAPAREQT